MDYMRYEPSDYYAEMLVRKAQRKRNARNAAVAALVGMMVFAVTAAVLCA